MGHPLEGVPMKLRKAYERILVKVHPDKATSTDKEFRAEDSFKITSGTMKRATVMVSEYAVYRKDGRMDGDSKCSSVCCYNTVSPMDSIKKTRLLIPRNR